MPVLPTFKLQNVFETKERQVRGGLRWQPCQLKQVLWSSINWRLNKKFNSSFFSGSFFFCLKQWFMLAILTSLLTIHFFSFSNFWVLRTDATLGL